MKLLATAVSLLMLASNVEQRGVPAAWQDATGNLAGMATVCGTVTMLSALPGSGATIAGVAERGLFTNTTGVKWTRIGNAPGSQRITNRPTWIAYDPEKPDVFWVSGIYGPGLFKTTDSGATFKQVGPLPHLDYVSVDFSDPKRQTILVGGHEQSQAVHKSSDGGETWINIGANLPADSKFSSNPLVINNSTYVVNTQGFGPGRPGVYRTADGGNSWTQVSVLGPVGAPLVTAKGAIYWGMEDGLLASNDGGLNWAKVGTGLLPTRPVELPNETLASLGATHVVVSSDGGRTWSPIGPPVPFKAAGLIYSATRKTFFVWKSDCGEVVPLQSILSLEHDFTPIEKPRSRPVKP